MVKTNARALIGPDTWLAQQQLHVRVLPSDLLHGIIELFELCIESAERMEQIVPSAICPGIERKALERSPAFCAPELSASSARPDLVQSFQEDRFRTGLQHAGRPLCHLFSAQQTQEEILSGVGPASEECPADTKVLLAMLYCGGRALSFRSATVTGVS